MNEQEFYQRLRERTTATPIPDALSPDAVSTLLKESSHKASKKKTRFVTKVLHRKRIWIPAAATFLLFCIFFQADIRNQAVSDKKNEAADFDTEFAFQSDGAVEAENPAETVSASDSIPSPENYEQLYSLITKLSPNPLSCVDMGAPLNIAQSSVTQESAKASDAPSQTFDTADTDLIQTDGSYLYSAYSQQDDSDTAITISKIEADVPVLCSTISTEQLLQDTGYASYYISKLYIYDSQLILLGTLLQNSTPATGILLYDISDPTAPIFLHTLTQDGDYTGSYLTEGCLYTFSSSRKKAPDNPQEYSVYIPKVDGSILSCSDIYLPISPNASCYQVMTGLTLTKPDSFLSRKAILADVGTYDVSIDAICFTQYNADGNAIETFRFSYLDGILTPVACIDLSESQH